VERPAGSSQDAAKTLRLDFRNVPLDAVLNYYSDAGGFIIMLETHTEGALTLVSAQPVNPEEAVPLLNAALNQIGCAAVREGRQLTIIDKQEAANSDTSVKTGNDPAVMPKTDEIATWIIPVRFIEAGTLVKDLSSYVSSQATIVANAAGNAIVVTDTQSHIRRLTTMIQAMDNSAEAETEIRVFNLKFANPSDVETELNSIFQNDTSPSSDTQSLAEFDGGGDNFAGAPDDGTANSSQKNRVQRATQVSAVADLRLQAVIVSAPTFLMAQIASILDALDVASERDQNVFVYHLSNGDPAQVVSVLQDLFQSSGASGSSSSSSQKSALQQRALNSATTMSATTTTSSTAGGTSGGGNNAGGSAAGGSGGAR
jgi:general secretion pathway protein D